MILMSSILQNLASSLVYDPANPLLFPTGLFWALLLVFLPVFALLRRSHTQMVVFVVLFSLFFYYKSSGAFVLMLLLTSVTDWLLSKAIETSPYRWQRRLCVVISLMLTMGMLVYFKYADFFMWNWNQLVRGNYQPLDLVLPVGISFYTFQSASYIIDVYRGKVRATRTWLDYAFFLSFFPALVAGPIVRAEYFLPQIEENRHATRPELYTGLWLIMLGVVKKAVIADYLAGYDDLIFNNPGGYTGFETLMGVLGYVMQIYCDFSGYSDMAIGLALLMGFRLAQNFEFPYKSKNIGEFWHRWHISLSSWMRDYIYIPLGGSRRGTLRTYFNNLVTMLLAGLWHGAGWKFVFWGGMHGVALVVHRICHPWLKGIPDTWPVKAVSWTLTMLFVAFSFVYFRADNVHDANVILSTIFTDMQVAAIVPFFCRRALWVSLLALIIVAHAIPSAWWERMREAYIASPWLVKLVLLLVVAQLVIEIPTSDVQPFIYFQF